jgi:hypothetical protein
MSKYFNYFPKTAYFLEENVVSADVVTNITSRFGFEQSFKNNSVVYYEYDIQDGDTPEIIASKLYGSPERHWAVLMVNDIIDGQFDWPLDQRTIIKYINKKYSANASAGQTGTIWAQANIHSYYQIDTRTTNSTNTNLETKIQVDANTYANVIVNSSVKTLSSGETITVATTKETKSYYDYEVELNESKRKIKILKPEFVSPIEQQIRSVFNT